MDKDTYICKFTYFLGVSIDLIGSIHFETFKQHPSAQIREQYALIETSQHQQEAWKDTDLLMKQQSPTAQIMQYYLRRKEFCRNLQYGLLGWLRLCSCAHKQALRLCGAYTSSLIKYQSHLLTQFFKQNLSASGEKRCHTLLMKQRLLLKNYFI